MKPSRVISKYCPGHNATGKFKLLAHGRKFAEYECQHAACKKHITLIHGLRILEDTKLAAQRD